MQLCVFTVPYYNLTLEETLKKLSDWGVQSVEIGAGGYPGDGHLDVANLLTSDQAIVDFKALLARYNISLAALSCHGNPVHPQPETALTFHKTYENTVLLAERLGIDTLVTFSGCPGDHPGALYPNWVTCPWPEDFGKILDYQWNEVLIPYWTKAATFALAHGVKHIALEMHPGFAVYNPETVLKLRAAVSKIAGDEVGAVIGANFDPSHLFWQGMDPVAAIRSLKGAIYHFHAKDTRIDPYNCAANGVLDNKHYGDFQNRSWTFRTVGYGHDQKTWNDIITALRTYGYDKAISIEHEDGLMSIDEGMKKAIDFLKLTLVFDSQANMWWA